MKCCGKCEFNKYDRENKEFSCNCDESEMYGLPTEYRDCCEEFVEKD